MAINWNDNKLTEEIKSSLKSKAIDAIGRFNAEDYYHIRDLLHA